MDQDRPARRLAVGPKPGSGSAAVRVRAVRFEAVRFTSVRLASVRFASVRVGDVRFASVRFGAGSGVESGDSGAGPVARPVCGRVWDEGYGEQ
ncbi:hypothetical protein ACQPZF_18915 [Actinosynnema sp. CS-041913]|uniref:hypothetical protein n=1 Tax=Actinosynnema sp. CS-041913 TaxID=3239917 RepID=UPI003D90750C